MFKHSHPGTLLSELYMKPLGLTVTATAKALRVSRKHLSELVNGRAGISAEMALRLSQAFNTTAEFWVNLQANYELSRAKKRFKGSLRSLRSDLRAAG